MESNKEIDDTQSSESNDLFRIQVHDREFILIGTAHISRESSDLVRKVIEEEKPDIVCVELDTRRHQALNEPDQWKNLDLRQIIKKKQLSALVAHLILSAYQKKLGEKLGVMPGTELLQATKVATEMNIPFALCDRDVSITLKRAWKLTPFWKRMQLAATLMASLFEKPELDESKLREIRSQDVLSELLKELGEVLPTLKQVLIDERDAYLAEKIRQTTGQKVVAVVGAGHVSGILEHLKSESKPDLPAIEIIPPSNPWWKVVAYAIPALIIGAILWISIDKGVGVATDNLIYWIFANGIPSAIGAMIALAHPLTILTAFVAAPFTSLNPTIGVGYVTALVQVWIMPPRVNEIQNVAADMSSLKKWWQNRLLKVFLAFFIPSLGSVLGTWIGGIEIFRNL